jgi:hypothetical protein
LSSKAASKCVLQPPLLLLRLPYRAFVASSLLQTKKRMQLLLLRLQLPFLLVLIAKLDESDANLHDDVFFYAYG